MDDDTIKKAGIARSTLSVVASSKPKKPYDDDGSDIGGVTESEDDSDDSFEAGSFEDDD